MRLIFQFLFFLMVPPLFLLWKIGDFYVRAVLFLIKAFFGIIAATLKILTRGALWPQRVVRVFYEQGVENFKKAKENTKKKSADEDRGGNSFLSSVESLFTGYKLRYVLLLAFAVWFFPAFGLESVFRQLTTDPAEYFSLLGAIELFFQILLIFLPVIVTLIVSALADEVFGDGDFFWNAKEALEEAGHRGSDAAARAAAGAAAGTASALGNRRRPSDGEGAEVGETALTSASHIETAADTLEGEEGLAGLLEGSAFEGTVAGAGSAGLILGILILAFIYYMFIAGVITLVLLAMTWGYVSQFIPIVAGPLLGALGLGEAYAAYFGSEALNTEAGVALRSGDLLPPSVGRTFAEAGARMGCFLEGPQCLREWRLNNTVRPGSESRGERYELQIQQFTLGTDRIDTAYKEADYRLPVNFLVSNTRNGLKGIPARNVSYRIKVKDFDKTYCDTDWRNISSFYSDEGRNVILPGLGVSPTDSLEELNLGNCGLLQPSLGVDRVLELQARYEYSSQATLYVDAMSRQYRREEGIEPSFEKSKTADTPVQSYINVKQPVTYYETEEGERLAVPFAARFGFETPGFDVRYRVDPDSVKIVDSALTTHVEPCVGIDKASGENNYNVSDSAKKRIELRQDGNWFNSEDEPAPLRCTMKLTENGENPAVDRISPTGEELVMRIDGNYTVVKEDTLSGFDAVNTLCTRYNCPLLVTEQFNESSKYNLRSKCKRGTSIDSRDGCTVRLPEQGNPDSWRTPTIANRSGENIVIEQGKVARNIANYVGSLSASSNSGTSEYFKDEFKNSNKNLAFGAPQDGKFEDKANDASGAILYQDKTSSSNLDIAEVDAQICEQTTRDEKASKYMKNWGDFQDKKPIYMTVGEVDCSGDLGALQGFLQNVLGICVDVPIINNCDQNPDIDDVVEGCEAGNSRNITVKTGDRVSCYGRNLEQSDLSDGPGGGGDCGATGGGPGDAPLSTC